MDKKILLVLGLVAVAVLVVSLNGKITGNVFAWNLPRSCTDSDGGDDPYVRGSGEQKGTSSVKITPFVDECRGKGLLLEHYCRGPYHLTRTVSCRCEDGACKK